MTPSMTRAVATGRPGADSRTGTALADRRRVMQLDAPRLATLRPDSVRTIKPELLLQYLRSGRRVTVLDVREPDEVAKSLGRMPGARYVPLRQLFARRAELVTAAHDIVVTVSTNGLRANAAAFTLALAGFADVRALEGGMVRWLSLGYPVE